MACQKRATCSASARQRRSTSSPPTLPFGRFPGDSQSRYGCRQSADPQYGNRGGDICQRPRCWYYRTGNGLFGTRNGQSLVVNGENQYHAIFGNGPAYFVSPSSLGPALIALGATVKVASGSGTRDIKAEDFFVVPSSDTEREIAIKPNEIVTEILIPTVATKNTTYELREREAMDWPLATASIALTMKGNNIGSARVVLGHVAPKPHVASEAEAFLAGKAITEETAEQAGAAAVKGAKPLSKNDYKVQLTKIAVKRALLQAAGKSLGQKRSAGMHWRIVCRRNHQR